MLILTVAVPSGTRALADFATPFADINNEVGDISEGHGYVVALGHENAKHFLVIVMTDTLEHVVVRATADEGVVKEPLLGRPAIIKAEVVDRRQDTDGRVTVRLKVLSVSSSKKTDGD
jgi:hypothetical protein